MKLPYQPILFNLCNRGEGYCATGFLLKELMGKESLLKAIDDLSEHNSSPIAVLEHYLGYDISPRLHQGLSEITSTNDFGGKPSNGRKSDPERAFSMLPELIRNNRIELTLYFGRETVDNLIKTIELHLPKE